MAKPKKTNSMRVLEQKRITYQVHTFPTTIHSAEGVAEAIGLPASQVFKTLVVMPMGAGAKPLLAIIPGDAHLNLKNLAKTAGEKKLNMAAHREAERLTGLQVGGISALAMLRKGWHVFLDASANDYEQIVVSAGQRGINLQLSVDGLISVTNAQVASIAERAAP